MLRRRPALPAVVAAAIAAGLLAPGCRRSAGPPPERFVAGDARVVVVVPELRRALRELGSLQQLAAAFPPAEALASQRGALATQLGFDPLDPDALARVGIDPARGMAVAEVPGAAADGPGAWLVVLPVGDERALEQLVTRLARERLGASERAEVSEGDVRLVTFRRPGSAAPASSLGVRARDRTAVLALRPDLARAALTLAPEASLAGDERGAGKPWRALRKALGDRFAVVAADLSPAWLRTIGARRPLALGASADPAGVRLGVAVAIADDDAALRALGGSGDAKARVRTLSPAAPLVVRWDGDPAALGKLLVARMAEADRRWLADHGLDPQRDLFDLLAPGVAASVSLSPRFDLSDFSEVAVRADPLRIAGFELAAEVKDEAAAGRALARLPALFAALEAPVGQPGPATAEPSGRSGRIALASGEVAWRLEGKRLLVAGGPPGALEALAARKTGWAPPTKDAAAALEGGLGGAVLSPRALVKSVRALPEDAFGTGPFGFVVRGVVDRYLEVLDGVQAVSARAELDGAALVVVVRAEAAPRRGEAKP